MTGLQLTRRQYYALCTMVLLSPLLHLVPRKTTAEAGCGGWLCALAALVPLLLFAWMLEGILHRGRPGEGIGEITLRALGPVAGRVLLGVYALWFLLYSAFALRIGAERFIEAVFPLSRPWPFVVTILTMAVCGALGSTKALFRASEIFLPLLMLVLALSKPALASVGLFIAVGLWNEYMHFILYITDPNWQNFQVKVRSLILEDGLSGTAITLSADMLKSATVVVVVLPFLFIYPFVQKYFTKGVTLGAVKG